MPPASRRNWVHFNESRCRKLVQQKFQEAVHQRESCGPHQQHASTNSYSETGGECERSRRRAMLCRKRLEAEQALNSRGEIMIIGGKRSDQKGKTRRRTHSRYPQERRCKRQRTVRISAHGFIVGSPFREFCPRTLDGGKTDKKRKLQLGTKGEEGV
jgi:hypothetical protein